MYKTCVKLIMLTAFGLALAACGGGGKSTPKPPAITPAPSPTPVPTPTSSGNPVTISGHLSYDFVPHLSNGGLDYNNTESRPIRGATVELVNSAGVTVQTTVSDVEGAYTLEGVDNTGYRVRVKAEYLRSQSPSWNVRVTDNTSSNTLYALSGSLISSGSTDSTRDLHAPSGWGGSSYNGTRSAAPFAILDSVYQMLDAMLDAGLDKNLPTTELRWSVDNVASPGSVVDGDIGTSHYDPSQFAMYILGDAGNDTDEYDRSVIQHEFGHFFEHVVARTDSIGGTHGPGMKLDPRLVFSEGLANALTALVSGSGHYEDSGGTAQGFGFRFSLENVSTAGGGWFNEASIGALVYDLVDPANEIVDSMDFGLNTFYAALSAPSYFESPAQTTVFSFLVSLRQQLSEPQRTALNTYALAYGIRGSDEWGTGETNSGSVSGVLPLYHTLEVGQSINVCSNDSEGQYNGLDVRRFVRVEVSSNAQYRFTMTQSGQGTGNSDPDMILRRRGDVLNRFESSQSNFEAGNRVLAPGTYVLEVYDYDNVDGSGGIACFDVGMELL